MRTLPSSALALLAAFPLMATVACAQTTSDPFPEPIEAEAGVILVGFMEFAMIPDIDGSPARLMTLVDEAGTDRLFVSDMRGPIYSVSYDGAVVQQYLNANDAAWGVGVESGGRERGVQSFAFHPQFATAGAPGFGKFYTWMDTGDTEPEADFTPEGGSETHHTVLLEWTASTPAAATYDGAAPRELARFQQPFGNHNGGHLAFHPTTDPNDPDFGLLYMGVADGGSGGDPLNLSQNLSSAFGKIFRIDPLGSNSANGEYGIPADNPWAGDNDPNTLGEIYAYGVRNPQRFGWDTETGTLYMADIGQNTVETLSPVPRGGNLGWNVWEGSFRFVDRQGVSPEGTRSDPSIVYPVQEYDQSDPIIQNSAAATGVVVVRSDRIPTLENRVLWGDFPSGEIFQFDADNPPSGGSASIRRVLLSDGGTAKTLLQVIREKNTEQGRDPANRTDLRMNAGPEGRIFLMNKQDGVIRELVPDA